MVQELSRHATELAMDLQQTHQGEAEAQVRRQEDMYRVTKLQEELHVLQQQQQVSSRSLAELQRYVTGRQRSRVKRLEAELTASGEASPLNSATVRTSSSPTPSRGSLVASTGVAILPGNSP